MKLTLNREFLVRHLFAALVFIGLGCWFGYDAVVRYPQTPAAELYLSIEGADAVLKPEAELEAFKAQKISMQKVFALVGLLAGGLVGLHLFLVSRFAFAYDDAGFTCGGKTRSYDDITSVDEKDWAKKGILRLIGTDWKVTLDAWHHTDVKAFHEKLKARTTA